MKSVALIVLALLAGDLLATPALDYAQAKVLADRDESSLSSPDSAALRSAQGALLEAGSTACATPDPELSALVLVMELDAQGKVVRTWLQGSSPLAICLRRHAAMQSLPPPPRVPFYTSIELSFTK
jgi:hypothetical protein